MIPISTNAVMVNEMLSFSISMSLKLNFRQISKDYRIDSKLWAKWNRIEI